jgi:arginyl-tRNA synthetase
MKDEIIKAIQKASGVDDVHLEAPEVEGHGDYSCNVAMQLCSKLKAKSSKLKISTQKLKVDEYKNPGDLAEEIVKRLKKDKKLAKYVSRIEVAGPGFINFWLSEGALLDRLENVNKTQEQYGSGSALKGKKILLEHTSPNTRKTLHVGHVRNNILGMAVHNIMEFSGADVTMDAINNDRGIHVMKAVWAYMKYGKGKTPESEGVKPDKFVDKYYTIGSKEAENEDIKEEMQELLRRWEAGDKEVRGIWNKLRDWTFKGFAETYKKLGSKHDHQWFESDFYEKGRETVDLGLKKRVFKKLDDGAVLSNLEKYKLSDAIILRADGTTMYHTQDLYLTQLKRKKYTSDLYIWDIGPEQSLYLNQLFAMLEQLGIGKRSDYFHLSYGYVFLKGKGKMSSRRGNVVSADWLMEEVVKKAKEIIDDSGTGRGLSKVEKEKVAESVGLAAIKYGLLKVARLTDLQFDIEESLSIEGNSGPYIQYTVARTNSVHAKFKVQNSKLKTTTKNLKPNKEEMLLLRSFVHFPEVVEEAAEKYAPNLICNYLFDLAQKYNAFYNQHRILNPEVKGKRQELKEFRLAITQATGQILKNGLTLLGIDTPERM